MLKPGDLGKMLELTSLFLTSQQNRCLTSGKVKRNLILLLDLVFNKKATQVRNFESETDLSSASGCWNIPECSGVYQSMQAQWLQSCLTLCGVLDYIAHQPLPMDFQAKMLLWVAISSSRVPALGLNYHHLLHLRRLFS